MAAKSDLTLVIGNKAYSSWSLRPWLLLRESGIPFQEILIPLYQPDSPRRIRERSPSGRVPALIDGATTIWDSLAICEYVAEHFPEAHGWPEAPLARAIARSVSAEMHSGFAAVRSELPDERARAALGGDALGHRPQPRSTASSRSGAIAAGGSARAESFLFGRFGIADAMYAPVVTRFAHLRGRAHRRGARLLRGRAGAPLAQGMDEGRRGRKPP